MQGCFAAVAAARCVAERAAAVSSEQRVELNLPSLQRNGHFDETNELLPVLERNGNCARKNTYLRLGVEDVVEHRRTLIEDVLPPYLAAHEEVDR